MNHDHEKISPDDPRLTAYALGELTGGEHAAVAAAVRADPSLAAEVDRLRAFSVQLRSALAAEPAPAVAPLVVPPHRAKIIRGPFFYWLASAAACLAVFLWLLHPPPEGGLIQPASGGEGHFVANRAVTPPAMTPATPSGVAPVAPVATATPVMPVVQNAPAVPGPAQDQPVSGAGTPAPAAPGGLPTYAINTPPPQFGGDLGNPFAGAGGGFGGGGGRGGGAGGGAEAGGLRGAVPGGFGGLAGGGRGRGPGPATVTTVVTPPPMVFSNGVDSDFIIRYPSQVFAKNPQRPRPPSPAPRGSSGDSYARLRDNAFTDPAESPFSTFFFDVDTASYANIRSFLTNGRLPPPDAVHIEELVNYFSYHYADATPAPGRGRGAGFGGARGGGGGARGGRGGPARPAAPFTTTIEAASAPWLPSHRLVRIALKARDVSAAERGPASLVFLADVSDSMDAPNRLPLVKETLRTLLARLRPDDRVAIVTYAGDSGLALPSTPVGQRNAVILDAIDSLQADGPANGGAGLQLAYSVAQENFNPGGVNRIILCTDGDFNAGVTGSALTDMVGERAKGGVFLTVLGFGHGNLKDAMLESLAAHGHGNYGYIDTRSEAENLFVSQLSGTLVSVAQDVKIQVEFNPAHVAAYRLVGYEDRPLNAQDFNNHQITAGVIGAGHTVTALYDIVPVGADYGYPVAPGTDPLRYTETPAPADPALGAPPDDGGAPARAAAGANSNELLTVKIRYQLPNATDSRRLDFPFTDPGTKFDDASADLRFAAAVAGFGMVLRESPYRGGTTLTDVLAWAGAATGDDPGGLRAEFLDLVRRARDLRREPVVPSVRGGTIDPLRY